MRSSQRNRIRPMWFIVITHVLALGVALNAFALADSAFRPEVTARKLPTASPKQTAAITPAMIITALPSPTAAGSAIPAETATPQATAMEDQNQGMWGAKFPDKFTSGNIQKTGTTYKSHDVNIAIKKHIMDGITYFIADIYIRNLENFQAAFVKDRLGTAERTEKQAKGKNAILSINGDNSGYRRNREGYEVRNGSEYLKTPYQDVLVMYNDGSMRTFSKTNFDYEKEVESGVWQVWSFGPMILDESGNAMAKFADPERICGVDNPRTAIGYYEQGHYCFIVVDGRQPGYSSGIKMTELSKIMYNLGCKAAYNLDGGQTSIMVFDGDIVNRPYNGGRITSDISYICEDK